MSADVRTVSPAEVDAIFAEWDRSDTPGAALAVMADGEIVYERGYGMANLSHGVAITPDTAFHIASVSKQFTAAAILLLAQDGRLELDDDVHEHLPELPDFGVPVTLRQLLNHTSGLRDQWGLLRLAGFRYSHDLITDADVMRLVLRQRRLNFVPGSAYRYSNTNTTLLGQVVQRLSGHSLREFTTRRIFEPLDMDRTHFRDDHTEIITGEAFGYVCRDEGGFRLSVTNFDTVGATSLYTTVRDMAKWDANLIAPRVGGPDFARAMTETRPLTTGQPNPYAMGLRHMTHRGLPTVEHSGADAGYRANFLRFPEEGLSFVLLCNTVMDAMALTRRVADLYLADRFPEEPEPPATREIAANATEATGKTGYYRNRETGAVDQVAVVDGKLSYLVQRDVSPIATDALGRLRLTQGRTIRFDPPEREAAHLALESVGGSAETFDRLPAVEPDPERLRGIAGTYESAEIDTRYRVEAADDGLILDHAKYPAEKMTQVAPDLFLTSDAVVEVRRNADGAADALLISVSAGRVQDVLFLKTPPAPLVEIARVA